MRPGLNATKLSLSTALALALACGGASGPTGASPPAGAAGSPGGAPGGSGGAAPGGSAPGGTAPGGGTGAAPAPARVTLSIDRSNGRDDAFDRADLDIARVLVFQGATPARPDDRAPCSVAGAANALDVAFHVALDLSGSGPTQVGRVDLAPGRVGEVRLLLRSAAVDERGRSRRGVGRLTCVDDAGAELIVVRLLPADEIELEPDRDEELTAEFDDRGHVTEEACDVGGDGGRDDEGCEADDSPGFRAASDHGSDDPAGHDGGNGGGGGGSGSGRGSRVLVADELSLARTR